MNSIKHRFTLDMHSAQSQISIPALLGDTGRSLHINFSDGGTPYFIETGCLAKLTIARPTETHIEEFCEIVNNSTVVYHFAQNENTCAVEGIHECDVTLYGLEGEYIASPRFSMIVSERVIRSDDINVTDEDRTVVEAMVTAEAQRQAAEALRVAAEAERVANEQRRQEASGTILAKAEEVATLTETATNAANTATVATNNATNASNNATAMAQNAANSASNAEQSAMAAKSYEAVAMALASDSVNIEARISRSDKLITNLLQGVTTIPVETDESVAYIKDVPSNALPYAEINKVGGMSYKDEATNSLRDSKVTAIRIQDSSLLIPAEIQSLDGYGEGISADCYNYIDFEKKQFVKRVNRVDMGTLTWTYHSDFSRYRAAIPNAKTWVRKGQCLTAMYKAYSHEEPIALVEDKAVYLSSGDLYVHDSAYTDAISLKTALSGVMLYYELETPQVTDLSHLLTDDNMIEVEGGGTITFENEHQYAVPSSITYMLKGAK